MSNGTYFAQRRWQQQEQQHRPDKHQPSPIELQGMKRRLEETLAYAMLDLDRLVLPNGITSPLQAGMAAFQQVLEHIQLQQSESADMENEQL